MQLHDFPRAKAGLNPKQSDSLLRQSIELEFYSLLLYPRLTLSLENVSPSSY